MKRLRSPQMLCATAGVVNTNVAKAAISNVALRNMASSFASGGDHTPPCFNEHCSVSPVGK
jgi:hypothetical protein